MEVVPQPSDPVRGVAPRGRAKTNDAARLAGAHTHAHVLLPSTHTHTHTHAHMYGGGASKKAAAWDRVSAAALVRGGPHPKPETDGIQSTGLEQGWVEHRSGRPKPRARRLARREGGHWVAPCKYRQALCFTNWLAASERGRDGKLFQKDG